MSRAGKIALGAATVWPFLYALVFFVSALALTFASSGRDPMAAGGGARAWFLGLVALHFLTMLWVIGLMIFYIVNVFRNDRVEQGKKVLWAAVLFFGNIFAMPIYWYLYIWREPSLPPAADTSFGHD